MSKVLLKIFTVIITTLIFIYAFSVSYTSRSIDNISYVIALGIDLADDKENLKVTFEFTNISAFSKDGSSEEPEPILETVTSRSVDTAINLLNVYLAKEVNLSHCKVIAISDKVSARGIFHEFSELMNNPQIRPTANIIITKGESSDYLKNSKSSLDSILTKYYDIFPNSGEYTGYTSNITIGEFYNELLQPECGSNAILGSTSKKSTKAVPPNDIKAGDSPISGDRNTENIGLAVFNQDKYIGDLTATETLYHCILLNKVSNFLLTLDAPEKFKDDIDISLTQDCEPKISVEIKDDKPNINIELCLTGKVLSSIKGLDYSDANVLEDISNSVNKYLEKNMLDYLNKTTSTFKCDIDSFYIRGKREFLTLNEWNKFNWADKYTKASFNLNVKTNIVSSLLVFDN